MARHIWPCKLWSALCTPAVLRHFPCIPFHCPCDGPCTPGGRPRAYDPSGPSFSFKHVLFVNTRQHQSIAYICKPEDRCRLQCRCPRRPTFSDSWATSVGPPRRNEDGRIEAERALKIAKGRRKLAGWRLKRALNEFSTLKDLLHVALSQGRDASASTV